MQKGALVLMAAVGAALVAAVAQAEPTQISRIADSSALEKRVAVLEQQNAELRRFIVVNGDSLTIKTPQALSLQAGTSFDARAQTNATIRASGEGVFESTGVMKVKGATLQLNGGSRPLARVGDSVQVTLPAGNGNIKQGSATVLTD